MLFIISSYLSYNQQYHHSTSFSTMHKYHRDQHLIDITTNNNQHDALHHLEPPVLQSTQSQLFKFSNIWKRVINNYAQISSWSASERLVNWAVRRRVSSSPDENNSLVVVDIHRARVLSACPQWERGAVVSSWCGGRELVEVSRGGF